jgi:hypothetical protein
MPSAEYLYRARHLAGLVAANLRRADEAARSEGEHDLAQGAAEARRDAEVLADVVEGLRQIASAPPPPVLPDVPAPMGEVEP